MMNYCLICLCIGTVWLCLNWPCYAINTSCNKSCNEWCQNTNWLKATVAKKLVIWLVSQLKRADLYVNLQIFHVLVKPFRLILAGHLESLYNFYFIIWIQHARSTFITCIILIFINKLTCTNWLFTHYLNQMQILQ